MALYAAYGSNLDPHRMAQRAPASPVAGTGWLRGWRLTFAGEDVGWDGALSTVVEDADSSVFVMLYDVPPRTVTTIGPDTYAALRELPQVVAVKNATGDLPGAARLADLGYAIP